ncbi:uncharacterized protein TNCV_2558711 [Trichonephila clavipes]|nr:uncharacterized protein TNCV_2558711 [Trichonephila clavipes]
MKQEMQLFDSTENPSPNIIKLCEASKTIPPTSAEDERAFSAAGLFVTKLRTRLSDKIVFKFFEILMHFRERQLYSRDFLDIPGKPETLHTGRPTGEVTSKNMSLTDGLDELRITTRYLSNGHSEVLTQHLGISGQVT